MTFSAYMPSITEVYLGTKYILNGQNNENYKMFSDAYDDSVTNSACINDIANLIVGSGLINLTPGGENPKVRISDKDVRLLVLDYVKQGAFTVQNVWDLNSKKPAKIFHLPIERTGLNVCYQTREINGYWYSYDWTKRMRYVPEFYPEFDGTFPQGKGGKIDGVDIMRVVRPSNEPLFPRPSWYSALRWAQDEGLMAQHSYRDIKTGFSGQKVINWTGGRGLTEEQKNAAAQQLRDKFSGIDGQRVIVSINNNPENAIVVDNIDPANVNSSYVNYTEEAERKILIAHSYPAILLAGAKTGFSSNADEIAVAMKSVYRRVINPAREVILEGLNEIFKAIDPTYKLDFKDFEEESLDTTQNTKA